MVQLQFKLHNQQTLDVSQACVLAYGHKSMVLQLGLEGAVYKVHLYSCSAACCVYLHKPSIALGSGFLQFELAVLSHCQVRLVIGR